MSEKRNGKGSAARNCFSPEYRSNFSGIDWSKDGSPPKGNEEKETKPSIIVEDLELAIEKWGRVFKNEGTAKDRSCGACSAFHAMRICTEDVKKIIDKHNETL